MIKNPATRIVAAVVLLGGLTAAPLLDNNEATDLPALAPLPVKPPRFHIERRRGQLLLSGHTASLRHEQDLLQVAKSSYPLHPIVTDFEPLGIVPDYWADMTLQILYLLAETSYADATILVGQFTIRSVIVDALGWQNRLDAVRKALPANVAVDTDALLIDRKVSVSEVCAEAFAAFDSGPINFEESSAEFRSSAYPRLDRVIAIANACGVAQISITGHTDSSGSTVWNERLSLRRAAAVGDYLVNGGIERDRLNVAGVGSTVPVADNSTRYGRSLNRRIEITLSVN